MQEYKGKVEYINDPYGTYSYLRVIKRSGRSIRTRADESWPRKNFIDDGDNLYFASFDPDGAKYLIEASIRIGLGHERREVEWTVEEIEDQLGEEIESTQQVVEFLLEELEYSEGSFPPPPAAPTEPIRKNPPVKEGDVLFGGRGINGISLEHREKVREMIRNGSVRQDELPPGAIKVVMPGGEERIVESPFEVQGPPKQV